jgi:hypothetical protein
LDVLNVCTSWADALLAVPGLSGALEGLVQERGNKELPIAATIEALKK